MTARLKLLLFYLVTSVVKCHSSETAFDVENDKNDLDQNLDYYDDYDPALDKVGLNNDTKADATENVEIIDLDNKEKYAVEEKNFGGLYSNNTTTGVYDGNSGLTTEESPIDTDVNLTLDALRVTTIQSPGYPEPYENNVTWVWNFVGGLGSGLEINVTDLSLNIEANDHLTITIGGDTYDPQKFVFTGYLKEPRHYRVLDHDSFRVEFVSNAKSSNNTAFRGFELSAKHIGIMLETEAEPINPSPLWVEEPLENITIYLSGKSPSEFLEVAVDFKAILQDMVFFYIDSNNITVAENHTDDIGVKYDLVIACNVNWPDTENCIAITFSAPVYFNASTGEYQLTAENMAKMWSTFNQLEEYAQKFRSLGLEVYHFPNDSAILTLWIAISLGVILGLLVLMYIFWRFNCFDEYVRMSRFSDTDSQMSHKKSDVSMFPTPHQTIPPLFGTEAYDWMDDSTLPNYEDSYIATGSGAMAGRRYDNKTLTGNDNMFFELDSDEEIVMSLPDSVTAKEERSRIPNESTF